MLEHISVSQIKRYLDCPLQYRFAWIDKIKAPIRLRTVMGKAVHKSYESNFKHKKINTTDMKVDELQEIFRIDFEKQIQGTEILKEEDSDKAKTLDDGVQAIKTYYSTAKKIIPDLIEEKFEIPYTPKIIGYIDLTTDKKEIIDYKVSKLKPNPEQLKFDLQRLVYCVGYWNLKKELPTNFIFDYIRVLKEPITERINLEIPTQTEIDLLNKTIAKIVNQMEYSYKTGNFYPTYNWVVCSWCGYYDKCREGRW